MVCGCVRLCRCVCVFGCFGFWATQIRRDTTYCELAITSAIQDLFILFKAPFLETSTMMFSGRMPCCILAIIISMPIYSNAFVSHARTHLSIIARSPSTKETLTNTSPTIPITTCCLSSKNDNNNDNDWNNVLNKVNQFIGLNTNHFTEYDENLHFHNFRLNYDMNF